eukprot:COSAG05_NODE_153_length_15894_cov_27.910415_11_plen_71_part_00
MKRERDASAEHDPEGADAGEPEPEDEAKEEFYDTTPVKSGLAFSFGTPSHALISPLYARYWGVGHLGEKE